MQKRLFESGRRRPLRNIMACASEPWVWQSAVARWRPGGEVLSRVVTTNLRSGYLRKNGLPYSEKTPYRNWDLHPEGNGDHWSTPTSVNVRLSQCPG